MCSVGTRIACVVAIAPSLITLGACAHSGPASLAQAPTYERGLQVFPSPRTFDPPGTIFRVDREGVRRPVVDLSGLLNVVPRDEAVPRLTVYGAFNAGAYFSWLGVSAVSAELEHLDTAVVEVGGAKREEAFEVDLRRLVDSAAHVIDWRKPGEVYLITETVLADTVDLTLSISIRTAVGNTLKADSARARGVTVRWTPQSRTHLSLRFGRPYRVFYKAEQLSRSSGIENDSTPKIRRLPIGRPLRWHREESGP